MKRSRADVGRSIFVTVGTTKFESLVSAVSDPTFLRLIKDNDCGHYTSITVQYGRGDTIPFGLKDENKDDVSVSAVQCSLYRFKPTLREDMEAADLILSHAGAGSIMEGLELCRAANTSTNQQKPINPAHQKKLVVVTNAALMHGHQSELADALGERGHLFVVNDPSELLKEETLRRIQEFDQVPFEGGDDGSDFAALIDNHFEF